MLHRLRRFVPREKQSLQTRFQVGLAAILFLFCFAAVVGIYSLQRSMLEREALRQTDLVMHSIQATRTYIREMLRPRMYELLPDNRFVIEAMSTSYVSRVIMENLKEDLPEFGYRRVAVNARNPDFEPNGMETEMIGYFRDNPGSATWSGVVRDSGSQRFIRSEPVRFEASCMHCHGKPADAPADIIERYGRERGFYHRPGEIAGVVSVSIPLQSDLAGIRTSVLWIFSGILLSAFLLYIFIRLFFRQLVVINLHELLGQFRETVSDAHGASLYRNITFKDELSELFDGTRLLAEHLRDSRRQLEGYASQLEEKVALRTEALERSHDQLRLQVRQRNRELHLFTTILEYTSGSEQLTEILGRVLQEILMVVGGRGGAIYLHTAGDHLEFCCRVKKAGEGGGFVTESTGHEPQNLWQQAPACNHINIQEDGEEQTVSISLCCRSRLLGIMHIEGLHPEAVTEPLRDLLGAVGNQIGIAVESIRSTEALRSSEKLLQSVFNGISDPLVLLDTEGKLKMVNDGFLRLHGLTRGEAVGRPLESVTGSQNSLVEEIWRRFDLTAARPQSRRVDNEDGTCYDVMCYPVSDEDGMVVSVICLARDVTEISRVEQKMRQTEKLVAVGQLAAGVAHEVNNPLWIILCHADIIRNEYSLTDDLRQDIETIERHAHNCRETVTALLNFARAPEGSAQRSVQPINDDVRAVAAMVDVQYAKQGIEIVQELDQHEPLCLVDSDRIRQVLMNLVMNAAQAIESNGTIRLATAAADRSVRIMVEDDGPGIPPDIIGNVFDPFFTTKGQGAGTGLGLSVSYGIIVDHGGEISVTSRPGKTVFVITLPRQEEDS